jgi:hypothetical protein
MAAGLRIIRLALASRGEMVRYGAESIVLFAVMISIHDLCAAFDKERDCWL